MSSAKDLTKIAHDFLSNVGEPADSLEGLEGKVVGVVSPYRQVSEFPQLANIVTLLKVASFIPKIYLGVTYQMTLLCLSNGEIGISNEGVSLVATPLFLGETAHYGELYKITDNKRLNRFTEVMKAFAESPAADYLRSSP